MERYNAFWRRLAARLFDGLVLLIFTLLVISFFYQAINIPHMV